MNSIRYSPNAFLVRCMYFVIDTPPMMLKLLCMSVSADQRPPLHVETGYPDGLRCATFWLPSPSLSFSSDARFLQPTFVLCERNSRIHSLRSSFSIFLIVYWPRPLYSALSPHWDTTCWGITITATKQGRLPHTDSCTLRIVARLVLPLLQAVCRFCLEEPRTVL